VRFILRKKIIGEASNGSKAKEMHRKRIFFKKKKKTHWAGIFKKNPGFFQPWS
jgi:hypothetical protein